MSGARRERLTELDALTDRIEPLCARLDAIWREVERELRRHNAANRRARRLLVRAAHVEAGVGLLAAWAWAGQDWSAGWLVALLVTYALGFTLSPRHGGGIESRRRAGFQPTGLRPPCRAPESFRKGELP